MYRVIFEGFDTLEQAREFANWYEGQGEQDSAFWLEEHTDLTFAGVDDIEQSGNDTIVMLDIVYKSDEEN